MKRFWILDFGFWIVSAIAVVGAGAFASPDSKTPVRARAAAPAIILRGFEPVTPLDGITKARALERAVPEFKSYGAPVHQTRVLWSVVEQREGIFDWSAYDRLLEVHKRHGIRWAPIVVVSGVDAVPAWMSNKHGFRRFTCVEHGTESPVASRWFPLLRSSGLKFLRAFCERYRDSGALESVTLGIAGSDGRAAMPGYGVLPATPGHLHPGLWIRDEYAIEAFQIWLASKYGGSNLFRDAWGGLSQGIPFVEPFKKSDAPTERAWLDQLDFAADSMTQWARLWLKEARSALPSTPLYLRTSADLPAESGVDLAAQARVAIEFGVGIQATFSAQNHRTTLTRTALASSASTQFKAALRLEAEGVLDGPAVTAGLFAASASRADAIALDYASLEAARAAREALRAQRNLPSYLSRSVPIAVYYPQTFMKLVGSEFLAALLPLRDRFDFDLVSDTQILQGGLERYKALVMLQGSVSEASVWRDVSAWTLKGGLLIHPEGMGRLHTVERDETYHFLLFAPKPNGKVVRAISLSVRGNSVDYRDQAVKILSEAPELSSDERVAVLIDGEEDGVYTSGGSGSRIWLNLTLIEKQKGGILIPPSSIATQTRAPANVAKQPVVSAGSVGGR